MSLAGEVFREMFSPTHSAQAFLMECSRSFAAMPRELKEELRTAPMWKEPPFLPFPRPLGEPLSLIQGYRFVEPAPEELAKNGSGGYYGDDLRAEPGRGPQEKYDRDRQVVVKEPL